MNGFNYNIVPFEFTEMQYIILPPERFFSKMNDRLLDLKKNAAKPDSVAIQINQSDRGKFFLIFFYFYDL